MTPARQWRPPARASSRRGPPRARPDDACSNEGLKPPGSRTTVDRPRTQGDLMKLLVRTLTISALAAIAAIPAAAAPPSTPIVRVKYGEPAVSWTLVPGSTADTIQFTRSVPANPNTFWRNADEQSPLNPRQTSWTAGDRFAPGAWYVHVASVTPAPPCPPEADECPDDAIEWSPATRFVVPSTPGIVAGKGVDFARLGMKTDEVRSILGQPPSLDGTRVCSGLRVLRRLAARPLRARPRNPLRAAQRPLQGRRHDRRRRLE